MMADIGPVTTFYGRWARVYDLVARFTPGIGSIRKRLATDLQLDPGETVVEMGCGTGANLPYLRERVGPSGTVVGVDITPGVLTHARDRVRRRGWSNVHVVRGDAIRPPIERADVIVGTFVVGMLEDPGDAVARWCDHLETGGTPRCHPDQPPLVGAGQLALPFVRDAHGAARLPTPVRRTAGTGPRSTGSRGPERPQRSM